MAEKLPHSIAHPVGQDNDHHKFRIENHDVQLHDNQTLDDNGLITPFVKGVLVHVGILGFIVLTNLPPNMSQQPAVQASLVTPDQLATIQSQVLANRSQAAKADTHDPNAPATNPSGGSAGSSNKTNPASVDVSSDGAIIPPPAPTPEANTTTNEPVPKTTTTKVPVTLPNSEPDPMSDSILNTETPPAKDTQKPNAEVAERQRQFDEALQAFEKEENNKLEKEKQQQIKQQKQQQQQQRERVAELKSAERKADKIVEENRKKLKAEAKKRAAEQAQKIKKQNKTTSSDLAKDGTPNKSNTPANNSTPPTTGYSGDAQTSTGAKQTQTNNLSQAGYKVKEYLVPPLGSGSDTTKLRITVNANGNVIRAVATGSNNDLNRAAEQAAKAASPLPIKKGDKSYPTFSFSLQGEGTL